MQQKVNLFNPDDNFVKANKQNIDLLLDIIGRQRLKISALEIAVKNAERNKVTIKD